MANDNDIIARLKVEGLNSFKAELAQGSKAADGTTVAIEKMEKAIHDATDPKDIQRLTKELEAVKVASEAGATAFESSKAKLRALKEEATGFATVLATMKQNGQQNTQVFKDIEKQFEATKKKAGQLSDQINDINSEIKALGSDTRGIDNVVRGATLMANSFQLATGVQALFGKENENLSKALIKLNGVMAITQSIQQIGNELTREDSIVKQAASKATALYALVVGESTGALKFFRLALAATGIGLAVLAIAELVKNWSSLKQIIIGSTVSLEDYNKVQEQTRETQNKITEDLKTELDYRVATGQITKKQAKEELLMDRLKNQKLATAELDKQLKILDALQKGLKIPRLIPTIFGNVQLGYIDNKKAIEEQKKIVQAQRLEVLKLSTQLIEDQKEISKEEIKVKKETTQTVVKDTNELEDELNRLKVERLKDNLKSFKDISAEKIRQAKLEADELNRIQQEGALLLIKTNAENQKKQVDDINQSNRDKQSAYEYNAGEQLRTAKKAQSVIDDVLSYGQKISSIAEQAIQIRTQNELQLLEDKKNRGLITEKQYEKQSAEIKNEAAKKKRAIDIANASAQVPVAVLSAFVGALQVPGIGFALAGVIAGIAGAFALAQVALVAAAPLPKFRDGGSVRKRLGLIQGKKHEQGGVPIEVEGDEFVVKSQATKKYGVKMLDDINNLRYNPILSANKKLKTRGNDMKLHENLATISSYLKQGTRIDAHGNQILKEISTKLNNKSVYV